MHPYFAYASRNNYVSQDLIIRTKFKNSWLVNDSKTSIITYPNTIFNMIHRSADRDEFKLCLLTNTNA